MHIVYTGALTLENVCVISKPLRLWRVCRHHFDAQTL